VLEEEGKLDEAIAEFKLALKSQPDNVAALTALGHAQGLADRSGVQKPSVGSEISGVVKKP
jgi:hypothetical protein